MLLKLFSPRDESGCNVKYDNEDFRKRNEGIQEMFVITILTSGKLEIAYFLLNLS